MAYEIIFVCNSINNKNIRNNELKILRKIPEELCFEFGESESNIKKRFYRNMETLNSDFEELLTIKERLENEVVKDETPEIEEVVEEEKQEETIEIPKKRRTRGYYKRNEEW